VKTRTKEARPVAKRFTVTIAPDVAPELRRLKQEQFFDKSQTEMLMHIIRLGLEAAKKPA
jgi:hypothetical protein